MAAMGRGRRVRPARRVGTTGRRQSGRRTGRGARPRAAGQRPLVRAASGGDRRSGAASTRRSGMRSASCPIARPRPSPSTTSRTCRSPTSPRPRLRRGHGEGPPAPRAPRARPDVGTHGRRRAMTADDRDLDPGTVDAPSAADRVALARVDERGRAAARSLTTALRAHDEPMGDSARAPPRGGRSRRRRDRPAGIRSSRRRVLVGAAAAVAVVVAGIAFRLTSGDAPTTVAGAPSDYLVAGWLPEGMVATSATTLGGLSAGTRPSRSGARWSRTATGRRPIRGREPRSA